MRPEAAPSGSAPAASRPRAQRPHFARELAPGGSGMGLSPRGAREPGSSADAPRCAPRGEPCDSASLPRAARVPSQPATPGGGREGTAGDPAGSRLGWATYLGRRGAPAGPRPGRAGGRARGARAAGAGPWWPAFGAAARGAARRARTIPRGRGAGAGRRDPRAFLPRGVGSEALAQRPRRRPAGLGFHFFQKSFPRVCARAQFWHEAALTVAGSEQAVRAGPGRGRSLERAGL